MEIGTMLAETIITGKTDVVQAQGEVMTTGRKIGVFLEIQRVTTILWQMPGKVSQNPEERREHHHQTVMMSQNDQ